MVQNPTWQWLLDGFTFELETHLRPTTVTYYCVHIRLFSQWAEHTQHIADPGHVTKRDIQDFFHYLAHRPTTITGRNTGRQPSQDSERTRWPYYRSLQRFFSWAVQEGHIQHNPIEGIRLKPPKPVQIEPYRLEHIGEMLRVLDYDWDVATTTRQKMRAARNRAVFLMFLESGLRLAELARLQMDDIDLEKQRIIVREGKMGKGRVAGFGPQTKKALWRYLGLRGGQLEHRTLWVSEELRPLTAYGVVMIIRRLKKDAGLQHLAGAVHRLRHTFATCYLRHTRDMKGCRLLLGHSTLDMTERYTSFIDAEDALKAYDGKGPLDWLREAQPR